jgi:hypothetical protein
MEEEEEETVAAATTMAEGATAETRVDESRNAPPLKVVVAVDASEESLDALSWALDNILRSHPDAALVVVHAQNLICPAAGHGIGSGCLSPSEVLNRLSDAAWVADSSILCACCADRGVGIHEEGAGGRAPGGSWRGARSKSARRNRRVSNWSLGIKPTPSY